jgi:stress response protein SCP2
MKTYNLNEISICGSSDFVAELKQIKSLYNTIFNVDGNVVSAHYNLQPAKNNVSTICLDYYYSGSAGYNTKHVITFTEFITTYKELFIREILSLLNISQTYSII